MNSLNHFAKTMIDWNEVGICFASRNLVRGRFGSRVRLVSKRLACFLLSSVGRNHYRLPRPNPRLGLERELVQGCPLGNGMERIQFILWSLVLGYLIIRVLFRLNLIFAAGVASIGGALSLSFPSLDSAYWEKSGYDGLFSNHWVELHASVAIFSYGIFGLLATVSVMYLIQRKALRTKRPGSLAPFLPSIQQMEIAGARLLLIGSVFLTCSIVVGSLTGPVQLVR